MILIQCPGTLSKTVCRVLGRSSLQPGPEAGPTSSPARKIAYPEASRTLLVARFPATSQALTRGTSLRPGPEAGSTSGPARKIAHPEVSRVLLAARHPVASQALAGSLRSPASTCKPVRLRGAFRFQADDRKSIHHPFVQYQVRSFQHTPDE